MTTAIRQAIDDQLTAIEAKIDICNQQTEKRCKECGCLRYSLNEEGHCTACQILIRHLRSERDMDSYNLTHAGEDYWTRNDYK